MRLHSTPRTSSPVASRLGFRAPLLATAAVLALSLSGAAWAQQTQGGAQPRQGTTAQTGQTQQGQTQQGQAAQGQAAQGQTAQGQTAQDLAPQLRTLEQSLRQSQQQLSGGQGQAGGQPNWDQMRSTVNNATQMLGRMPQQMQGQEAFQEAQRELNAAREAIQGQSPDRQQAATRMGEAADAVSKLHGSMDTASTQRGTQGGAAGGAASGAGAQIQVQQPSPQVTVTQPAPDVTVRQAQPQVTVQQPEPKVTIQQADPKVTVQQGQPQVTVQKQGQPTVDVQRQGQAQVTTPTPPATTQTSPTTARPTDQTTTGTATGTTPGTGISQGTATGNIGLPLQQVSEMIGTNVVGADGKNAGEIENLLVDSSGRVRAAVIEWGGFLGIGQRRTLVPIERIQMGAAGSSDRPRLEMTREELEAMPRYEENQVGTYARDQGWGDNTRMYR